MKYALSWILHQAPISHLKIPKFLKITLKIFFLIFAPITAYSSELKQIREFELIQLPRESYDPSNFFKNPEDFHWEKVKIGGSILFKRNHVQIFKFNMPENEESELILQLTYGGPEDEGQLGEKLYVLNENVPTEIPPIDARYTTFIVSKIHNSKVTYITSKRGLFSIYGPVLVPLSEVSSYHKSTEKDRTYIGLIVGIIGIMALYNLGMFLLFKKRYLLYYLIYCCAVICQFSQTSGLFGLTNFSSFLFYFSILLIGTFLVLFSMEILEIKHRNRRLYFIGLAGAGGLITLTVFALLGYEFAVTYFLAGTPPLLLFSFFLAMRSAYSGYKPAYAMVLGWSALFLAFTLVVMQFLIRDFPNMGWAPPIAFAFETATFSFAMGQKLRMSELKSIRENQHAFTEMAKMVYPHQLTKIRNGQALEVTMPTATSQACVLSFDIVGSSRIHHINAKEFFRNTFTRCNEIISEGYDGENLKANAYRIKEMGDGFLCSVGYPFAAMSKNPANDSVDLAKRFALVLQEEAQMLHSETPIACGIGIALDTITGFYPEAGTKEYDLYGQAIVLATRYEGMRKTLFEAEKGRSVLIIQEKVFQSLDPSHRAGFIGMDLKELGIVVRDDPAAVKLYYQFLDEALAKADTPPSHLKVV